MWIEQITTAEANAILTGRHYLGAVGFSPEYCFSTPERDAVAVYGVPIAASFKLGLPRPLELLRLWQADSCERQVSEFLSGTLRWLRKNDPDVSLILSYADPSVGHEGNI